MTYWLDYSAAKLSGTTIRNAGYTGAIRYVDAPAYQSTKHTNPAEYRSLIDAGLQVLLVFEIGTNDAAGGYDAGVDHARRALLGAGQLGYNGPIFFCNDQTTLPPFGAWQSYLDGAALVLGFDRVGAYGFASAMDAAVGHAEYFWQCGARSVVREHVHIWQDNNVQVNVGGITCDRNLILKDLAVEANDLTPDQDNRLKWLEQAMRTVVNQLTGDPAGDPSFDANMNWQDGHLPGFPSLFDGSLHTATDYARLADLHSKNTEDAVRKAPAPSLTDQDKAQIAAAILAALPATLAQQIVDEAAKRLDGGK